KCMASLFTDRAISYRVDKGFTSASGGKHGDVALSVCVQKMVRSDMACSGVMFTIDTESGFKDVILINGSWGLGELVVKGQVSPDEYCIFKPLMGAAGSLPADLSLARMIQKATLSLGLGATRPRTKAAGSLPADLSLARMIQKATLSLGLGATRPPGFVPIVERTLGTKKIQMKYALQNGVRSRFARKMTPDTVLRTTKIVPVSDKDQKRHVLDEKEIMQLARWGIIIEDYYKRPMDIEWAQDGRDGKFYIVQARPETVQASKDLHYLSEYKIKRKGKVLLQGPAVGSKIGIGPIRVIKSAANLSEFKKGEILVTEMTDPDWEPIMKIASAIVTNAGGRTCHAAIVSRELGIPAIVGTKTGTDILKSGTLATV
ncbi:MAG: hypothetical protein COY02_04000, partial [Parcubacteria group bacterium CG_4_10_14_0_2_um_filter_41_6]